MADEEIDVVETGEPKSGKKRLIMAVAGVLFVAIVAIAAYMLLGDSRDTPATPSDVADPGAISRAVEDGSGPEAGDAIYVGMPRPFVFNVPGDERDRLVQIKVQLLVRGTNNEDIAKRHIPLIEGTLLQVFSSMTADELQTAEGKDKIRELGLEQAREVLREVTGKPVVDEVLFNGFVLQ